jgi:hypothetical protein
VFTFCVCICQCKSCFTHGVRREGALEKVLEVMPKAVPRSEYLGVNTGGVLAGRSPALPDPIHHKGLVSMMDLSSPYKEKKATC